MRGSNVLLGVFLMGGVGACGPAEAPPPAAPTAPKPSAEPKKAPIVEDRTPAEAPAGLVVQAHSVGLKTLVRSVKTWLPANAEIDPRGAVAEVTSPVLERLVDIDKPVDLAVVVEGKDKEPHMAFAFGVEDGVDVAAAIKEGYHVDVAAGGVQKLVPNTGSKAHCVVAPAIGAAKHRLICARHGDDPMVLAPWLARGVTRKEAPTSAVRIDVDVATLKKTFPSELEKGRAFARGDLASEVKTGYAELDRALKTVVKGLADEVFDAIEDLDAISLDATPATEGVQLALTTAFSGTKSWTARLMLAGGDTPTPANPRFAKLPGEGGWLAMFSRANPQHDALIAPVQSALRDVVTALATDFKWPAKDRDLALDVVKLAFPASADTAMVAGNQGKVEWPEGAPKPHGDFAHFAANYMLSKSWSVSVVERDPKIPVALAKAIYAWATRPSFADTYRALTKDRLSIKITSKPLTIKDLPKGGFAQRAEIEMSVPPLKAEEKGGKDKGKAKPKPKGKDTPLVKLVTETIVAPEGTSRAWIGWSQNLPDGDLWKRLSGASTGTATGVLGARPGFDFIVSGTPTSGGLIALDGFAQTFVHKRKTDELIAKLPDQGHGAFEWRITPSKPPKSTTEIAVLLPRDIVAAAYFVMSR